MEYATKEELDRLDKRLTVETKENREYIDNHSQEIARLKAVYHSLEGLPTTITNLDKTITIIGINLESVDKNLSDLKSSVAEQQQTIKEIRKNDKIQNANIEKIDNKSKIDWAVFVTNNLWKIFAVFGMIYIIINFLTQGGP